MDIDERIDLEESQRALGKIVKISLILGILVVSGFIIYYVLNPEPGYVTFGLLNEDKKAEDYPTTAAINEDIYFYVTVGNYLREEFTFHLKILRGDNETELSSSGSEGAELNFTTKERTLEHQEEWISDKYSISFSDTGENHIIIVELYQITDEDKEEFYNILFLRINVTAS